MPPPAPAVVAAPVSPKVEGTGDTQLWCIYAGMHDEGCTCEVVCGDKDEVRRRWAMANRTWTARRRDVKRCWHGVWRRQRARSGADLGRRATAITRVGWTGGCRRGGALHQRDAAQPRSRVDDAGPIWI